ncbi:hypothetical protein HID58_066202 [Brassica napus]|uniref:Uncharacterized protein n=1 Tax=Brassica napus TaxID=3708 RepID=A0ABQ7ZF03_BRANA|nr:hypothetical protein HID58_066202 [Brassica napus]
MLEYPSSVEVDTKEAQGVEPEVRPPGVKAAKASTKKKKSGREEELSRLHGVTNSCHYVLTGYSHVGRSHGCIWSLSDGVGFTGDGVGITGVAVEVTGVGVGSTGVVV